MGGSAGMSGTYRLAGAAQARPGAAANSSLSLYRGRLRAGNESQRNGNIPPAPAMDRHATPMHCPTPAMNRPATPIGRHAIPIPAPLALAATGSAAAEPALAPDGRVPASARAGRSAGPRQRNVHLGMLDRDRPQVKRGSLDSITDLTDNIRRVARPTSQPQQ